VPAIANAIHDAIGVWLEAPPYTPDKVLKALRRKARQEAQEGQG
jgi:CO/xanthine dehydrogenase Mo-binding subunit